MAGFDTFFKELALGRRQVLLQYGQSVGAVNMQIGWQMTDNLHRCELDWFSREQGHVLKALLIIDMQNFVLDRIEQGVQYYPENCIENMKRVLDQFRQAGKPVVHVRHQSLEKESIFHESSLLSLPLASFEELADEPVFIKSTSSAFSSTELFSYLQTARISELVVIGAVAGFCVNSTVRMGADLGLKITVVKDAVISFELGQYELGAAQIHNVTLALLDADFASIIASSQLLVN